jgi:Flp pilus assembly protein TadG
MANPMTEISLNLSLLPGSYDNWKAMGRARREDAQSLVELALMMPLFILILLGSAEFARFAWAAVLTSNAARAGAAFGAVNPTYAKNTAGIQAAAAADSVNLTGLTTTPGISCVCSSGASIRSCITTALTDCAAPATITDYITVNTTSTVTPLGHYPGLPTSFTATGQSTMVIAP